MTYEYAAYFRLLLLCGYRDELDQYIDGALAGQDPISDIVLDLSAAGNDDKKILSALNGYLLRAKESDIDYDKSVFDLVMAFLRKRYRKDAPSMKLMTDLMHRLAAHTERYFVEPWQTMYCMSDLYDEAQEGIIDKAEYQHRFDAFLSNGLCSRDNPPMPPKESFFRRWIKRIIR